MASKTPQFTLGFAWQRLDSASRTIVAGKVLSGICQLEYCDSEPAQSDLGVPFTQGEPFSVSIATGDQLWAKASGGLCRIALFGRAS